MEVKNTESTNDRVRLNVWIHSRHHSDLKKLAEYEGRSISDLVKQAIISHLKDSEDVLKTLEEKDGIK